MEFLFLERLQRAKKISSERMKLPEREMKIVKQNSKQMMKIKSFIYLVFIKKTMTVKIST